MNASNVGVMLALFMYLGICHASGTVVIKLLAN